MIRARNRLVGLCVLSIIVCSCAQRSSVRKDAEQTWTRVNAGSLADYIRGLWQLSSQNSVRRQQEAATLLSLRPELSDLVSLVEQNPTDPEPVFQLAQAYMDLGLNWSAYELLNTLQVTHSENTELDLRLARIWDLWGQYNVARQHAERALARNASPEGYELLGGIHLHRNSPSDAIQAFLLAENINPDKSEVLANLGYAYILQKDWFQARTWLERAIVKDPSLVEAQNNLALVLSQLGNPDGALTQLLKTGRPAVAHNNMGVLYLQQQRLEEARQFFKESLRLDPTYENARRNLRSVESMLPPPSIIHLPSFAEASSPAPQLQELVSHEPWQKMQEALQSDPGLGLAMLPDTSVLLPAAIPTRQPIPYISSDISRMESLSRGWSLSMLGYAAPEVLVNPPSIQDSELTDENETSPLYTAASLSHSDSNDEPTLWNERQFTSHTLQALPEISKPSAPASDAGVSDVLVPEYQASTQPAQNPIIDGADSTATSGPSGDTVPRIPATAPQVAQVATSLRPEATEEISASLPVEDSSPISVLALESLGKMKLAGFAGLLLLLTIVRRLKVSGD